jgi:hypothetical protein
MMKNLSSGGDYAEKERDSSTIKSELFLTEVKMKTPKYLCCELIF